MSYKTDANTEFVEYITLKLTDYQTIRAELEAVKAGMNKIKADAILTALDTPHDCETPNGDIAWSSGSLELISKFHLEQG